MKKALVLGVAVLVGASACTKKETQNTETKEAPAQAAVAAAPAAAAATEVTELKMEDTKVGSGTEATSGKRITVHYTGTLTNGTKFDSSVDRGQPFTFTLGMGEVIQGWDKGFAGMKVGGKRKLTIPGSMAYGPMGTPDGRIPPNATLVFDVELLSIN